MDEIESEKKKAWKGKGKIKLSKETAEEKTVPFKNQKLRSPNTQPKVEGKSRA